MTIRRMHFACWMTKATNTHSEHAVHIPFPLQQWLDERVSISRYTWTAVLLKNSFVLFNHVFMFCESQERLTRLLLRTGSGFSYAYGMTWRHTTGCHNIHALHHGSLNRHFYPYSKKVKSFLSKTRRHTGGAEALLYSFLTQTIDGIGQLHAPAVLPFPPKNPRDPSNRRLRRLPGFEPRIVRPVAPIPTIYWLHSCSKSNINCIHNLVSINIDYYRLTQITGGPG